MNGHSSAFYFEASLDEKGLEHERDSQRVEGYDSSRILCSAVECPDVDGLDLEPLIKSQLEAKFPYTIEQLIFDWDDRPSKKLVVAEYRDKVTQRLGLLKSDSISKCMLHAEGLSRAFVEFESIDSAILLWWHDDCLEIVHVDRKKLVDHKSIQLETFDIKQSKQLTHLKGDVISMVEKLNPKSDLPIYAISHDSDYQELLKNMSDASFDVQDLKVDKNEFNENLGAHDFIKCWPAIGMGLILQNDETYFDLFKPLSYIEGKNDDSSYRGKIITSVALFVLMVCAYFYTSYLKDVKTLESLQFKPELTKEIKEYQLTQELKKKLIGERPDLLHLIDVLSPKDIKGITLDQLIFKKGVVAKVVGRTKNDMHFKYVESLQRSKDLTQVKLVTPTYDKSKRETTFSITFEYQKWNCKATSNPLFKYGN